jgi:hypothetical protein
VTQKNTAQRQAIEAVRQSYARLFAGQPVDGDAEIVAADLRRFCRAESTTFHPDARLAAMLDGRREVWLRIHQFSTMSVEEIIEIRNLERTPQ